MSLRLKKPWFKKRLFISDNPYYLERSQKEGEQDLVSLARKAKQEDSWIYEDTSQRWLHIPDEHYEKYDEGRVEMGTTMPGLIFSADENPTHYHIHPDLFVSTRVPNASSPSEILLKEYMHAYFALPSDSDLECSVSHPHYKFKIATSKGITTYKAQSRAAFDYDIAQVLKDPDQHIKIFKERGFKEGLQSMINRINNNSHGSIQLSFKPLVL